MTMSRMAAPSAPVGPVESLAQRDARLAFERQLIEEARLQALQGQVLDADEFDAWLDTFDGTDDVPPPPVHPPTVRRV